MPTEESVPHPVSFFVARNNNWTLEESQEDDYVTFDVVKTNSGNLFNSDTNSLHVTQAATGLYWFFFSAGLIADTQAEVCLESDPTSDVSVCVVRRHSAYSGTPTMTSRDLLARVEREQELLLYSQYALYSDDGMQTSLGGFLLNSVMTTLVALCVETTSTQSKYTTTDSDNKASKLTFETVHVDTYNAWSVKENFYTVPVGGIYVVSITACVFERRSLEMYLIIDNNEYYNADGTVTTVSTPSVSQHSEDTATSRTSVVQLAQSSHLHVSLGRCVSLHIIL